MRGYVLVHDKTIDLTVLFATSHVGRRQDTTTRSLRIKNLPPNTQEPLLQQALEKLAPITRVQVLPEADQAIVEFTHAAVRLHVMILCKWTFELTNDLPL